MNLSKIKIGVLIAAVVATSGCGVLRRTAPKTPVLGERIAVLTSENDAAVDPATAALPMTLPPPVDNAEWAQAGGTPSKSVGHVALGTALGSAWTASIGAGSSLAGRLGAPPVVADGRVYTIDTQAVVRAFDTRNGGQVWAAQFGTERGNNASLYGGGIAYDQGRIYATNGLGFVAAIDARNGGTIWQVRLSGPLRGAPTVTGEALYVMSQDNQLFSLKTSDGSVNWSSAAAVEIAGVFGTAAPAFAQGTVVAGFSSGELNAYRYENGRLVWQDTLQRTTIRTSVASLSDVDASPVIDGGQVFAVGQGGRMVALDLPSGQRIWEINVAGISTPWVAGDWVFVVTDDARLVAVQRTTGKIKWIQQLQQFEKPKSRSGLISYSGPVLAGGRLVLLGSNGAMMNFDPATGSFQSQTRLGSRISLPPVVAGSTLYVLDDSGRLHAWR